MSAPPSTGIATGGYVQQLLVLYKLLGVSKYIHIAGCQILSIQHAVMQQNSVQQAKAMTVHASGKLKSKAAT
jgi:hypothetical protein